MTSSTGLASLRRQGWALQTAASVVVSSFPASASSESAGLGAHGQVLHTDDQTHPELLWALRGGGGNFGVATRLQFRLHQLDQSKSPKGHDHRNAEPRKSSWSPTATAAPPGRSRAVGRVQPPAARHPRPGGHHAG